MTPVEHTREAVRLLRAARDHLKAAGAGTAMAHVQDALKSTYGAVRHAEGLELRERYGSGRWAQDMEG